MIYVSVSMRTCGSPDLSSPHSPFRSPQYSVGGAGSGSASMLLPDPLAPDPILLCEKASYEVAMKLGSAGASSKSVRLSSLDFLALPSPSSAFSAGLRPSVPFFGAGGPAVTKCPSLLRARHGFIRGGRSNCSLDGSDVQHRRHGDMVSQGLGSRWRKRRR